MRTVPPANGFSEVLTPGDLARRNEERQRREGIAMPCLVWDKLVALGKQHHIDCQGIVIA
jgi:LDH2 family malate/lactate/ureidoglycolate dehydrogenase